MPLALAQTSPSSTGASNANAAALPSDAARLFESERFRHLATELRCLVCQNQSLADSSAPLAQDLRNEVARLMAGGADDSAIKRFLVDRYGEFVLYRPAVSGRNALLWFGPCSGCSVAAAGAGRPNVHWCRAAPVRVSELYNSSKNISSRDSKSL